ncbi:hypothetical protein DYB35_008048 [Aphanomyces astaci]|nr:hypothetical protein DYB35_008048 [Aphanomyces astaci]
MRVGVLEKKVAIADSIPAGSSHRVRFGRLGSVEADGLSVFSWPVGEAHGYTEYTSTHLTLTRPRVGHRLIKGKAHHFPYPLGNR